MIVLWIKHRGQRPGSSQQIRDDIDETGVLPDSINLAGVKHGRRGEAGNVNPNTMGLQMESVSQTDAELLCDALSDLWGGTIDLVQIETE
jgi:hypothetical protein